MIKAAANECVNVCWFSDKEIIVTGTLGIFPCPPFYPYSRQALNCPFLVGSVPHPHSLDACMPGAPLLPPPGQFLTLSPALGQSSIQC